VGPKMQAKALPQKRVPAVWNPCLQKLRPATAMLFPLNRGRAIRNPFPQNHRAAIRNKSLGDGKPATARVASVRRALGPCQADAPARALPFSRRQASLPYQPDAPARGLPFSLRTALIPYQSDARVLMLRLLGRRPEGAVTNQPRATPWDHVQQPGPSTESAIQNSVPGGLRARKRPDLWRPCRAFPFLEPRFPGRCPGLACCFPFGAEFQNSATSKRATCASRSPTAMSSSAPPKPLAPTTLMARPGSGPGPINPSPRSHRS
jgi:hypothetical protein